VHPPDGMMGKLKEYLSKVLKLQVFIVVYKKDD
jgi:hypothetical protein